MGMVNSIVADPTRGDVNMIYFARADQPIPHSGGSPEDGTFLIKARLLDSVTLGFASSYGAAIDLGAIGGIIDKANTFSAATTGKVFKTKVQTLKVWQGSTDVSMSFEIEFITYDDPIKNVRDPIVQLYKMSLPNFDKKTSIGGIEGLFMNVPPPVNIYIPGILTLSEWYVSAVNFTQSNKLMRANPKSIAFPMKARGAVTVEPRTMLLGTDVDKMIGTGSRVGLLGTG